MSYDTKEAPATYQNINLNLEAGGPIAGIHQPNPVRQSQQPSAMNSALVIGGITGIAGIALGIGIGFSASSGQISDAKNNAAAALWQRQEQQRLTTEFCRQSGVQ